ncbi:MULTISPECIES: response regulator [unclassified Fusibacter]|uniref:response regulator n=1 Tax=unclassified Fusibacter TaxID=2624464 RepID=UPI0010121977|nr:MULTISPECIES: response regulator [unclassified Fusibacter]MCK8061504.1 response regulator [Fusibacter sp. A2]NPE23689.1 response regulator [Fusibacter sp. A1]RXV58866.1 response regulator [Fusibacter sp. A1]
MNEVNVMVVDDEIDVFLVTRLALRRFHYNGYTVNISYAESAEEAIHLLSSGEKADLIFLDIVMETANAGYRVIEYIKSCELKDKILIYIRSGFPGNVPKEYMHLVEGVDGYMEKVEVSLEHIENAVKYAIDNRYAS